MKETEKLFKVLADRNRIRILKLLETRKCCVCELSKVLGITQPSVSRHLKKLKSVGLICDEQEGLWTNYVLSIPENSCAATILAMIRSWLNDDAVVKKDLMRLKKADRIKLCCRPAK
jgi:ArsR family transcriptional regulator, arsenate/arsenite/antimonite-responsive transcriptional repressor